MKYIAMVRMVVEADSDTDAYLCLESAVENMVCGDIQDASVYSVNPDTNTD